MRPRTTVLWVLAAALGTGAPAAGAEAVPDAPPGLRCLADTLGLTARFIDGAWWAELPGGDRLPWDDGVQKDPEARLGQPDLEDTLAVPYVRGPARPVDDPAEDPGRARSERLLEALYPRAGAPIGKRGRGGLVRVRLLGQAIRVHEAVAAPLARVERRLRALLAVTPSLRDLILPLGGGFVDRPIAGTERRSAHAFGLAVDLHPERHFYWRWQRPAAPLRWRNQLPDAVIAAFEGEGFIWGGRWHHYDTMHFEYRPEILACAGGDRPASKRAIRPPATGGP